MKESLLQIIAILEEAKAIRSLTFMETAILREAKRGLKR